MRARSLELQLVAMGAVTAADIAARNGELREQGLLPIGGRGPHAPDITAEHAGNMFLGLAHPVAAGAGLTAKQYRAFVHDSDPEAPPLGERLTSLLADPSVANDVEEIRMCRSWPWVIIVTKDGRREVYRPKRGGRKNDHMSSGREEYVIGSFMLHQIAIDLDLNQGWPGEE